MTAWTRRALVGAVCAVGCVPRAQACVQGQITPHGIVYPELGPRCATPPVYPSDKKAEALADERRRSQHYGGSVRHLSDDQCYAVLRRVPGYVAPLNHGNEHSPYLTPQENWCMALGRGHESPADNTFPGLLPDGVHATYLGNGAWSITP